MSRSSTEDKVIHAAHFSGEMQRCHLVLWPSQHRCDLVRINQQPCIQVDKRDLYL